MSYQGVRIQKTVIESIPTDTPATTHQITIGTAGDTSLVKDITNSIMLLQTSAAGNVHGMEFRNYDAGGTAADSTALNGTAGLNYIINKGTVQSSVLPVFTIQQIDSTAGPQIHFDTIYAKNIIADTVQANASLFGSMETAPLGSAPLPFVSETAYSISDNPWFNSNFVSAPPALTFGTVINTSTDIYIFWTPPAQQAFGFMPYLLPALDGLVLQAATATNPISVTTSATPGLLNTTNGTPAVTGLKLSWQAGTSGVAIVTPPNRTAQPMYCYFQSNLRELVNENESSNVLTGYYTNAVNSNNPATINYGVFVLSPTVLVLNNATNPLAFSAARYSTRTVYAVGTSGPAITNLLISTGDWATSFHVPVQLAQTKGVTSTVMTLFCSIKTGAEASVLGGSVTFTGFSLTKPSNSAANNLAIALATLVDSYESYSAASQGQFSDVTGTFTASGLSALTASRSVRTLTLTQDIPAVGSTAAESYSATQTFYNDAVFTAPTGTFTSISMASSGVLGMKVCGVYVVSVPKYSITYTPANLGTYFYASPLVSITGTNIAPTTVDAPPNSWLNNERTAFLTTLPGTTTEANGPDEPTYDTSVTAAIVLNNPYGTSSTLNKIVNVVIDRRSYTTAGYALQTPTGNPGHRVQSPGAPSAPAVPFAYTDYLNDEVIVGNSSRASYNNELQLVNGAFQSGTASDGYKNYGTLSGLSTYNNGTLNYTGVTTTAGTYRYATFAWQVQASANSLSIAMSNPSSTFSASSGVAQINGTAIKLYYCFQDMADQTPAAGVSGNYSTQWIDGNATSNPVANGNYNQTRRTGLTTAPTGGVFALTVPFGINYTNQTIYLYCMVGLPMNVQCSFDHLTATLSMSMS